MIVGCYIIAINIGIHNFLSGMFCEDIYCRKFSLSLDGNVLLRNARCVHSRHSRGEDAIRVRRRSLDGGRRPDRILAGWRSRAGADRRDEFRRDAYRMERVRHQSGGYRRPDRTPRTASRAKYCHSCIKSHYRVSNIHPRPDH